MAIAKHADWIVTEDEEGTLRVCEVNPIATLTKSRKDREGAFAEADAILMANAHKLKEAIGKYLIWYEKKELEDEGGITDEEAGLAELLADVYKEAEGRG